MTEIESYFASLYARVGEALDVPFKTIPSCESSPARCHQNVDGCVARNQHFKAVRGWLMEGPIEFGSYRVIAHSVLDDAGRLFDITEIDSADTRPKFLRHVGTEEQFNAMKSGRAWLYYPPLPANFDPVSDECDIPQY